MSNVFPKLFLFILCYYGDQFVFAFNNNILRFNNTDNSSSIWLNLITGLLVASLTSLYPISGARSHSLFLFALIASHYSTAVCGFIWRFCWYWRFVCQHSYFQFTAFQVWPWRMTTTITIVRKKYLVFAVFSRLFFDHFMESFENQIFKIETLGVVGNKAKGQISKLVLQENKAREIFRKTNISYPWHAHARVHIRG